MKAYISRNFTEFGPFKTLEIEDFMKRGILRDSDFVRMEDEHHWIPLAEAALQFKDKPSKALEAAGSKSKRVTAKKKI